MVTVNKLIPDNNGGYTTGRPNRQERRTEQAKKRKAVRNYNRRFGNNDDWGELNNLYQQTKDIFKPMVSLADNIQKFNIVNYLYGDEIQVFKENIDLLTRDVRAYQHELEAIHTCHADKTGSCSLDDIPLALEITNKYFIFKQTFEGNISPVYNHIVDIIRLAEYRMNNSQAQTTVEDTAVQSM